jgi:hypothetical protein
MKNANQLKAFKEYATYLANQLKSRVPKDSGELRKSITVDWDSDGFEIDMADYATFVDKGVNGTGKNRGSEYSFKKKMPPISALKGFAKRKGLNVYALQKSIFKNGIKGTGFIEKSIGNTMERFGLDLASAIVEDFNESAKEIKNVK